MRAHRARRRAAARGDRGHDPLDSTSIDAPVPAVVAAARERGAAATCPGCASAWSASWAARATSRACGASFEQAVDAAGEARRRDRRGELPALRVRAGRLLPDPAQRVSSNLARFDAMRYGLRVARRRASAEEVMARHPRGRLRRRGQAADHPRHVRAVVGLLRRLLRAGAEGPHADHAGLRGRVRAGRRAGLARRRRPPRSRSATRWTTRWPCTSTTSPRSRRTSRASPRCPCRAGSPRRTDGLPVGLQIMAPALGEAVMYRVGGGVRGRARRRRRRPAIRGADLEVSS